MFVELIELLRCPAGHEPSPLVASAFRTEHRHIVEGVLGCPACQAEFRISGGVVVLGEVARPAARAPDREEAIRLAAFLELTDARGFAVLCGRWGAHAPALSELSETPLVLVNPPEGADAAAAVIIAPARLPFSRGVARAAALESSMSPALVHATVECVRAGGRLVGDAALPVPDGVTEIDRDGRVWVGERAAASPPGSPLVHLERIRPTTS